MKDDMPKIDPEATIRMHKSLGMYQVSRYRKMFSVWTNPDSSPEDKINAISNLEKTLEEHKAEGKYVRPIEKIYQYLKEHQGYGFKS